MDLARAPEDIDSREGTDGVNGTGSMNGTNSEAGRVYRWEVGVRSAEAVAPDQSDLQRTADQPVVLEDVERTLNAVRQAREALASMAEAVSGLEDAFQSLSGQFGRTGAPDNPGPDAARWRPDATVRHCPLMFREEEHPGHPDTDLSGNPVQCPGYPITSIMGLAPDCGTGDVRTCTLSGPLHG